MCSCVSTSMDTRGEDATILILVFSVASPQSHIPMIVQVNPHEIAITLLNKISYEYLEIIFCKRTPFSYNINLIKES